MGYVKQGRPQEQDWVDCQKQNSRTSKQCTLGMKYTSPKLWVRIGTGTTKNNQEGGLLIATNIMKHSPASQASQATPQHGLHYESSQQHQHEQQQQPPQKFTRRIGKNYYEVVVHFSNTSKENIGDKVTRLIRNEIANTKAVGQ